MPMLHQTYYFINQVLINFNETVSFFKGRMVVGPKGERGDQGFRGK